MQKEDEAQHVQVKCSILRLFTQLLRSFDTAYTQTKKTESALDLFLSNPNFKNQIQQLAFSSKNPIIQCLGV